ncbi:MAG: hypothetical protein H7Y00_05440 [Fimbriimonadaceae bacterium]|nr:hypothetical protein [Chitinophagales bacterium]
MHTTFPSLVLLFGDASKFEPGPLYAISLSIHSVLRYFVLIFLIYAIVTSRKTWKSTNGLFNKKPAFFSMITIDIMFLVGVYMWGVNFLNVTSNFENSKRLIKAPYDIRFQLFDHPIMMTIAIILVHIGYARSKKAASDQLKGKNIFIFYLIALIIIIVAIPWPFLHRGASWGPSF